MADEKPPKNKGGRPKGSISRSTKAILEMARSRGPMPLEVMLGIMRARFKDGQHESAMDAAQKCAPYLHPKLANTQVTGAGGGPLSFYDISKLKGISDAELATLISLAEKLTAVGGAESGASEEGSGEAPEEES